MPLLTTHNSMSGASVQFREKYDKMTTMVMEGLGKISRLSADPGEKFGKWVKDVRRKNNLKRRSNCVACGW